MLGSKENKSRHVLTTRTTVLQSSTEDECSPFFTSIKSMTKSQREDLARLGLIRNETSVNILLLRRKHGAYLRRALRLKDTQQLPGSYISLDSSKPWIIYWTLNGLDLLDDLPDEDTLIGIVHTLRACWTYVKREVVDIEDENRAGGFGGGVNQLPHCATTYASVNALSIIAGCDADIYPTATRLALHLLKEKRKALLKWFITLRYKDSMFSRERGNAKKACGYRMHHDGEVDVRATYCICSTASLLGFTDEISDGMMEHIIDCQTFEGGFGGEPFAEAHGGYTFCALGALHILLKAKRLANLEQSGVDLVALEGWLVRRQMSHEGGFNGRCNKLVDGCYTMWVGGAIAILGLNGTDKQFDSGVYSNETDQCGVVRTRDDLIRRDIGHDSEGGLLFDQKLLQRYVFLCAQDVNGGLRDKPSKPRDFYHSCYNLSGLSVSQHIFTSGHNDTGNIVTMYEEEETNVLAPIHPVYSIRVERVRYMVGLFHVDVTH